MRYRRALLEDREGNIWLGTDAYGLYRLRGRCIDVLSVEEGLSDRNIYPIFQSQDGAVWIGSLGNGLCRYFNGRFTTVLPGVIKSLGEDREGRLWVNGDPYRRLSGRLAQVVGGLRDPSGIRVTHQDRRGAMWLGGSDGLRRKQADGSWRLFSSKDGLAGDDIEAIADARDGGMWAAGMGGLSYVGEDGRIRAWTEQDGLPANHVRALYEDSGGVLWIGTYDGGLGRFDGRLFTRYSVRDGLFDKGVFQILEDRRGNLWFSCNRGIYRVNKQQLNDFATGRIRSVTSFGYGRQDGMRNEECNGGFSPAGFQSPDGRLWFPTQDGVAIVNPEKIPLAPTPPPVLIESVLIDQAAIATNQPIRIRPGQENLEIKYTGLRLSNSAQIRFKYRLVSLDRDWVDVGLRRTAYYQHVPPGSYVFRVTAAMADGAWNDQAAELPIVVLPAYYQTWWCQSLGVLAVVSLLWLYWRSRLRQWERARAAQQAFSRQLIASQENERKRIAAELHDGLGQRLVIIKNLALFFLRSQDETAIRNGKLHLIEEISQEATLAADESREISYNLRPFQLDRLGVNKAIESLIRAASEASNTRFSSELDNVDDVFPEALRINFYRIVQECLNNIVKHAQAKEASVSIKRTAGRVVLTVRDNGTGFVPANGRTEATNELGLRGFGLTGMEERARALGGDLTVQSLPGRGTVVSLVIRSESKAYV